MSALRLFVTLLLLAGALPAPEAPTHDPLPPRPAVDPLIPERAGAGDATGEAAILERVERRVRRLEREINGMLRAHDGVAPPVSVAELPQLAEDCQERDLAWRQLRRTLDAAQRPEQVASRDPLERPFTPTADPAADPQALALIAENRLAMAQCHMELVARDRAPEANLEAGSTIVAGLQAEHLPPTLLGELHYLRVWYPVARARASDDPAVRERELETARAALADFAEAHPDHLRLDNARILLEQVALDHDVETVKREAGL